MFLKPPSSSACSAIKTRRICCENAERGSAIPDEAPAFPAAAPARGSRASARAARATARPEPIGLSSKTRTKAVSIASTFGLSAAGWLSRHTAMASIESWTTPPGASANKSADANSARSRSFSRSFSRSSQRSAAAAVFCATVADSLRTPGTSIIADARRAIAASARSAARAEGDGPPWRSAPSASFPSAAPHRPSDATNRRGAHSRHACASNTHAATFACAFACGTARLSRCVR